MQRIAALEELARAGFPRAPRKRVLTATGRRHDGGRRAAEVTAGVVAPVSARKSPPIASERLPSAGSLAIWPLVSASSVC